jgi:hypothetical protein
MALGSPRYLHSQVFTGRVHGAGSYITDYMTVQVHYLRLYYGIRLVYYILVQVH